jgi:RNA polymerase sigma factor (sigma-70 family)
MPHFERRTDNVTQGNLERLSLDERFISFFMPTPLERVEAQEFRQIVLKALQQLEPDELRIMEMRFQRKKSPGQAAALLRLSRHEAQALEDRALAKLRGPITDYLAP